jgi:hypothetical protein
MHSDIAAHVGSSTGYGCIELRTLQFKLLLLQLLSVHLCNVSKDYSGEM